MNKFISRLLVAALPLSFAACSDDDGPDHEIETVTVSNGAFIVNSGNLRNNIPGSLTFIDYATGQASQDVFKAANGRVLGDTPQNAVVYGSKMYIAVYQSNLIEVVDRVSLKSLKTIPFDASEGQEPRFVLAHEGKVYASMYNGYVQRIDTLSLSIDGAVKVGPNPEEMCVAGDYLYVANSDGMNYQNGYVDGCTVSKIALGSFSEEKKINVGINPTKMASDGNNVYVITMGDYSAANPATLRQIVNDNTVNAIAPATLMGASAGKLYFINAPYGASSIDYKVLDTATGTISAFPVSGVDSPAAIAVDPVVGDVFVTSYNMVGGYASYSTPGYVEQYKADGSLVKHYDTGVGPCYVNFNIAEVAK